MELAWLIPECRAAPGCVVGIIVLFCDQSNGEQTIADADENAHETATRASWCSHDDDGKTVRSGTSALWLVRWKGHEGKVGSHESNDLKPL